MMKARLDLDDRKVVLLGLSHRNLDKLRADGLNGCIEIKAEEIGIDFDIIITAAETEQAMLDYFQAGITEGTKLRISEKLKQ